MEQALALCYQTLNGSDDQIAVIDTKYHYVFANEAYLGAYQKSMDEIENRHIEEILGTDTFNTILRPQLEECYAGKEVTYERWIKFNEKTFKFMRVSYAALRDTKNHVRAIAVFYRDLTAQKQLEVALTESKQIIEQISITDWVTELHSKVYFDDVFPKMINISKRNDQLLSFGLIDIDHFTEYNETYGENAGDDALKKIAGTLKGSFHRPNDYIFRLDGNTFAMLFNVAQSDDAKHLCEKIHQYVKSLDIEHVNSPILPCITVSIGITVLHPDQEYSADIVYRKTQELLKSAKSEGKNRICYALG
ncbi:MAG: diguanylate cyclase [Sulfurimonas sp.]